MNRAIRTAIVGAAVLGSLLFLAPAPAQAQVRVEGRFRLPHGDVAIRVGEPYYRRAYPRVYYGSPAYPIGSYVPHGYRVIRSPRLGDGFYSPAFVCHVHGVRHSHWVPVRTSGRRYIVVERPVVVVDRRYDDQRYDRYEDGAYQGDPY
jgi:hypothetical protein